MENLKNQEPATDPKREPANDGQTIPQNRHKKTRGYYTQNQGRKLPQIPHYNHAQNRNPARIRTR